MKIIKKYLLLLLTFLLITCNNKNNNQNNKKQLNTKIQIRSNYELFFDEYNFLINYQEKKYYVQLTNCQKLIKEINQYLINLTNDNIKIRTNKFDLLMTKINHKQQWLTNNHLGYGYRIISIIQIILSLIIFVWYLDNHFHWSLKEKPIIGSLYTFLFDVFIIKNNSQTYIMLLIYFLLQFIFHSITPFEDYLVNSIHYLFTKKIFEDNYSLPKNKACYFYYDHSTKAIINDEKYFTIPFLFVNNNYLITNIIDLITNLFSLTIISWSVIKCFDHTENNLYTWHLIRLVLLTLFFTKLFSLLNIVFIHLKGENNILNQWKLMITSFFKSLPIINKFYYVPKHNYFKQKLSPLLFQYLIPIISIIVLLLFSRFIDFIICKGCKINNTFWFKSKLISFKQRVLQISLNDDIKNLLLTDCKILSYNQLKDIEQRIANFYFNNDKKTSEIQNIINEKITEIILFKMDDMIEPSIKINLNEIDLKQIDLILTENEKIIFKNEIKPLIEKKNEQTEIEVSSFKVFMIIEKISTKEIIISDENLKDIENFKQNYNNKKTITNDIYDANEIIKQNKIIKNKSTHVIKLTKENVNTINNIILENSNDKLSFPVKKITNKNIYDNNFFELLTMFIKENDDIINKDKEQLEKLKKEIITFSTSYKNIQKDFEKIIINILINVRDEIKLIDNQILILSKLILSNEENNDDKNINLINLNKFENFDNAIVNNNHYLTSDEVKRLITLNETLKESKDMQFSISDLNDKKILRKIKKRMIVFTKFDIETIDTEQLNKNEEKQLYENMQNNKKPNEDLIMFELTLNEKQIFNNMPKITQPKEEI